MNPRESESCLGMREHTITIILTFIVGCMMGATIAIGVLG